MCACAGAQAGFTTIDFSMDDSGDLLVNGQDIMAPDEFGAIFTITSGGGNAGPAIFDTDPAGPNAGGPDDDLLVGLGNALILQASNAAAQTVPGFFDVPNDASNGGRLFFNFNDPAQLLSIDLIDVNGGNNMSLTLTDTSGLTRVYTVPEQWSNDVLISPVGFGTLDLTTLLNQPGEGVGGDATALEDAGFDASSVIRLEVFLGGSGAVDNFTFVPAPGAVALAGVAGLAGIRRKR